MGAWWGLFLLSGFLPWWLAWRASRGLTLRHPLAWGALAWATWLGAAVLQATDSGGPLDVTRYVALCLTACTGVAVLGARRPGVTPWHLVVVGLLAGLLRPLVEGFLSSGPTLLRLESPHILFLAGVLGVGVVNYLPTRMGLMALALGAGCAVELASLAGWPLEPSGMLVGRLVLAAAPWLGLACVPRKARGTEVDTLWLGFRDRYGLVWGQRSREQFNRSAANSGWPLVLTWWGLHAVGEGPTPDPDRVLAVLKAVVKRFGL